MSELNELELDKTESRKYIRYQLEEEGLVKIYFTLEDGELVSIRGLVLNSSFGGNELLVISKKPLSVDQKIEVKFSELGSFKARIAWLKELDEGIYRAGVQYVKP